MGPRGRFRLQEIHSAEIMVMWVTPGFPDEVLSGLTKYRKIRGIVLLLYGVGNAPSLKEQFLSQLRDLMSAGKVIVACSQCSQSRVVFEKYAVSQGFREAGVVEGFDMTTEAAVTKMAYLFSKKLPVEEIRRSMGQNLRGEITTNQTSFTIEEPVSGIA